MKYRHAASAICLFVGITTAIPAGAKAIEYSTVFEWAAKLRNDIAGMDGLFVQATFDYSRCGVKAGDIQAYIQTPNGAHLPLVFDKSGHAPIPLDTSLDSPATMIVSSQDKGIGYSVNLGIRAPAAEQMSFHEFMNLARQYSAAMRAQLGLLRFLAPKITGLALIYADADAVVIQHGPTDDTTLHAVATDGFHGLAPGTFVIKILADETLQGRNIELHFTNLPQRVEPLFDADFESKIARAAKDCKPN